MELNLISSETMICRSNVKMLQTLISTFIIILLQSLFYQAVSLRSRSLLPEIPENKEHTQSDKTNTPRTATTNKRRNSHNNHNKHQTAEI